MGNKKIGKYNQPYLRKGKNSDLKLKGKGGRLVWAAIGDYMSKGEQRVILHEVDIDYENKTFCYGHKRVWNFPVNKRKKV